MSAPSDSYRTRQALSLSELDDHHDRCPPGGGQVLADCNGRQNKVSISMKRRDSGEKKEPRSKRGTKFATNPALVKKSRLVDALKDSRLANGCKSQVTSPTYSDGEISPKFVNLNAAAPGETQDLFQAYNVSTSTDDLPASTEEELPSPDEPGWKDMTMRVSGKPPTYQADPAQKIAVVSRSAAGLGRIRASTSSRLMLRRRAPVSPERKPLSTSFPNLSIITGMSEDPAESFDSKLKRQREMQSLPCWKESGVQYRMYEERLRVNRRKCIHGVNNQRASARFESRRIQTNTLPSKEGEEEEETLPKPSVRSYVRNIPMKTLEPKPYPLCMHSQQNVVCKDSIESGIEVSPSPSQQSFVHHSFIDHCYGNDLPSILVEHNSLGVSKT